MPRSMVMLKANSQSEAGVMPSEQVAAQMDAYNDELVGAGVRLAAEGLQPSSKGARVYLSAGTTKVVDGPFAEAKELVAGFWILQCRSLDECVEWVKRVPVAALPGATGEGEIDILQIFD
ncbi:MAG TPA: YciI family protein [Candidatus Limnocylindrales bacterium]